MAVDDLKVLRDELPEVFDPRRLPPGLDDPGATLVRIDDVESLLDADQADQTDAPLWERPPVDEHESPHPLVWSPHGPVEPASADTAGLVGGAQAVRGPGTLGAEPPPDADAFYLPFHYYYPDWWGVYVRLDRARLLAARHLPWGAATLPDGSQTRVSFRRALRIMTFFLYAHEAFHHATECCATRLEVTHRSPFYKGGFARLYRQTVGTDQCDEEALANAHALRRTDAALSKDPLRRLLMQHLVTYVLGHPPGYRRGAALRRTSDFDAMRCAFAEKSHRACLPGRPGKNPALWRNSPHLFNGIARITSRVNYFLPVGHPLANRVPPEARLLRFRDMEQKLRGRGAEVVSQRGSHVKFRLGDRTFTVPNHGSGDLGDGLVRSILRQAGLEMSVSAFRAL